MANSILCNCCDGFNLACTTKLDACTIVARGIMICVLCCMHEMSFAEGIATAVVNPRIRLSVQLSNILICFAKHALVVDGLTRKVIWMALILTHV